MHTRYLALLALVVALISGCSKPVEETPLGLGKAAFDAQEWDEAVEHLTAAIAQNPLDAEPYLLRGQAYMCKGKEFVNLAMADYNEALRIDPNNYEAYYCRAIAYKEKGDAKRALADDLNARRLDPMAQRSGGHNATTVEEYRKTLQRVTGTEEKPRTPEQQEADLTEVAPENVVLPGTRKRTVEPAEDVVSRESAGGMAPEAGRGGAAPPAAGLRDAYGMPMETQRPGSVTQDLFSSGRARPDADAGEYSSYAVPNMGGGRGPAPKPVWQIGDVLPPPLTQDAATPPPPKPSVIGQLPVANPFQPQQSGGNFSPYSPYAPRPTGLGASQRAPSQTLPRVNQPFQYQRPGVNNNTLPRSPFGPGLSGPMVDPR